MSDATDKARIDHRRIKPTLDTKFCIDYDWWERSGQDLQVYLVSHLLPEQREYFAEHGAGEESDWVDPETAEVHRVDGLRMALQQAAQDPSFITPQTALVDAVFRVFLANNNVPLTPVELEEHTGRRAMTILRTLASGRVYKGLRPYIPD